MFIIRLIRATYTAVPPNVITNLSCTAAPLEIIRTKAKAIYETLRGRETRRDTGRGEDGGRWGEAVPCE